VPGLLELVRGTLHDVPSDGFEEDTPR
jgi:hypothetical protein